MSQLKNGASIILYSYKSLFGIRTYLEQVLVVVRVRQTVVPNFWQEWPNPRKDGVLRTFGQDIARLPTGRVLSSFHRFPQGPQAPRRRQVQNLAVWQR